VVKKRERALFLDRDGVVIKTLVINGKPVANHDLENLEYIPGIFDLVSFARDRKLVPILITNQPDIARGIVDKDLVDEMNSRIVAETGIEEVFMCSHDDLDRCNCRKPLPGLFYQARLLFNLDLECSFMVGDRWRDVQAAQNAGIEPIYLEGDYQELAPDGVFHRIKTLEECKLLISMREFAHD
jgi:D-glycero-D-manno-heptose 1,7-bisphosphate phosphatase